MLCYVCDVEASDDNDISCDLCRALVHTTCSGLSRTEVQCVKSKNRKLSFYCVKCNDFRSQLPKINDLTSVVAALQEEVIMLKSKLSPLAGSDLKLDPLEFDAIVREVSDRESRRNNLVLFNLPELPQVTKAQQSASDLETARKILSTLNVATDVLKTQRLGKYDETIENRKRPLKVTLSDGRSVMLVLRRSGDLRKLDSFKSLSISRDKTPQQQQLHKFVKEQMSARIAAGETGLSIKFQNDVPKIVKSVEPEN